MHSLLTYVFWLLIVFLRILTFVQYLILHPLRFVLNFIATKSLAKVGVKVVLGQGTSIGAEEGLDLEQIGSDESREIEFVVNDPNLFLNMATQGSIAVGEGYLNGVWECSDIQLLMKRVFQGFGTFRNPLHVARDWIYLHAAETPWDDNKPDSDWITGPANKIMIQVMPEGTPYSSGFWDTTAATPDEGIDSSIILAQALTRNMEILSQKLDLRPGMRILDIGCGTGEFALYLSRNFPDVQIVGINNCSEEIELARQKIGSVQSSAIMFIIGDYRAFLDQYTGHFDRVVCLHMLEHIGGPTHYRNFFDTVSQYLNPNGRLLLQSNVFLKPVPYRVDLFVRKYLATHAVIPMAKEILEHAQKGFDIENIESIGQHYRRTVAEFQKTLEREVKGQLNATERKLARAIDLGFQVLMAGIDVRQMDAWQVLISKMKPPVVYKPK